ncbi:unnamed protein product [Penicillium pancosmium]
MSDTTDEASKEGHDLTHNAEVEKEKYHEREAKGDAKRPDVPEPISTESTEGSHKESTLHKVKDAFHRQMERAEDGI